LAQLKLTHFLGDNLFVQCVAVWQFFMSTRHDLKLPFHRKRRLARRAKKVR